MKMISSQYYLRARLFPTLLTSIPILSFYFYFLSPKLHDALTEITYLPTAGDISISLAVVYLLVQVNRFISKEVFQRIYFKDEIKMPTTNFLLHNDNFFSEQTTVELREKIEEIFNTSLLSKKEEEENELHARKRITSVVALIREYLRDNKMLLRHNIEYGFVRNLLGGSLLAIIICLISLFITYKYVHPATLFNYFGVLLIIYSIPIFLSKWILSRYGHYYAKILYEQFQAKAK